MFADVSTIVDAGYDTRNPDGIIGIGAHHTVSFYMRVNPTVEDELNHIKFINLFHNTAPRLWGGIGYTALVFMSGRGYICGSIIQQRAGVASRNHEILSFAFVGNLQNDLPTPAAMETARALVQKWRWELERRVPVKGHRDWALPGHGTACPGNRWQEWVPELDNIGEEPMSNWEERIKKLERGIELEQEKDEIRADNEGWLKHYEDDPSIQGPPFLKAAKHYIWRLKAMGYTVTEPQ